MKYQIYCISSINATDRRINVLDSARKNGWDINFFAGVFPPRNHEEFEVFKLCLKYKFDRRLIIGEVGVAMSHLLLWERLLESEDDFFIIFEDDARFVKTPSELEILADIDFQMLNKHSTAHEGTIWLGPKSSGLYGYVVHKSGAEKFLARHSVIDAPIDIMLLRDSLIFGGALRVAVTEPIVEHDDEIKSEIGNARILFSGRSR